MSDPLREIVERTLGQYTKGPNMGVFDFGLAVARAVATDAAGTLCPECRRGVVRSGGLHYITDLVTTCCRAMPIHSRYGQDEKDVRP